MQNFFYSLNEDVLTIYNYDGMSIANISEITSETNINELVENTLFNLDIISGNDKIRVLPY